MKKFKYKPLNSDTVKKRASEENKNRDTIFKEGVKIFKVKTPEKNATVTHRLRILPPTWDEPEHWGFDIWARYKIGPDKGTYLDLTKMKDEADPITEEQRRAESSDPKYAKSIASAKRVCAWVIDRDNEDEGPQLWPMAWTVDRDICKQQVDKATGDYLDIVDPENGYDISFDRTGQKDRTKYSGVQVARRSTPLHADDKKMEEWLTYVQENPIPDTLIFHDYEYLEKVFSGHIPFANDEVSASEEEEEEVRSESASAKESEAEEDVQDFKDLTWDSVHNMDRKTLTSLGSSIGWSATDIEDVEDDNELADLICAELSLEKPVKKESEFKKKLAALRAKREAAA